MAEDRGPDVAGVAILFLVLAWVFVSLRCYVRLFLIKSFGKDDLLAVIALILFSLYCTFVLLGVKYGTGQHLQNIPPENIPIAIKWWWCCELAYISSTAVVKASISIFLMRICVARGQKIAIWIVLVTTALYSVFYFFVVVFQCSPSTYFWTQYLGAKGTCLNPNWITTTTYAHSAVSVVADWTLGLLPVFLLWDLEMNSRTKLSVGFILSLGAIASTATIVRIPYVKQLGQADFLYSTTDVAIWSTVEPGIGLAASAMATLRPLFRTFFARSKLWGGSTPLDPSIQPSGSMPWPSSHRAQRKSYILSSSSADAYAENTSSRNADLEMALRNDLKQGTGTVTTVSAIDEPDEVRGEKGHKKGGRAFFRSERSLDGVNGLRDDGDSSDEILPESARSQAKNHELWGVRKTTEVRMDEGGGRR